MPKLPSKEELPEDTEKSPLSIELLVFSPPDSAPPLENMLDYFEKIKKN